jgi:hypothetical protein
METMKVIDIPNPGILRTGAVEMINIGGNGMCESLAYEFCCARAINSISYRIDVASK